MSARQTRCRAHPAQGGDRGGRQAGLGKPALPATSVAR
jgi:hypothetical protein